MSLLRGMGRNYGGRWGSDRHPEETARTGGRRMTLLDNSKGRKKQKGEDDETKTISWKEWLELVKSHNEWYDNEISHVYELIKKSKFSEFGIDAEQFKQEFGDYELIKEFQSDELRLSIVPMLLNPDYKYLRERVESLRKFDYVLKIMDEYLKNKEKDSEISSNRIDIKEKKIVFDINDIIPILTDDEKMAHYEKFFQIESLRNAETLSKENIDEYREGDVGITSVYTTIAPFAKLNDCSFITRDSGFLLSRSGAFGQYFKSLPELKKSISEDKDNYVSMVFPGIDFIGATLNRTNFQTVSIAAFARTEMGGVQVKDAIFFGWTKDSVSEIEQDLKSTSQNVRTGLFSDNFLSVFIDNVYVVAIRNCNFGYANLSNIGKTINSIPGKKFSIRSDLKVISNCLFRGLRISNSNCQSYDMTRLHAGALNIDRSDFSYADFSGGKFFNSDWGNSPVREASFENSEFLSQADRLLLDGNKMRGVRLAPNVNIAWYNISRNFTGASMFFNILLLVMFLTPILAKVLFFGSLAQVQELPEMQDGLAAQCASDDVLCERSTVISQVLGEGSALFGLHYAGEPLVLLTVGISLFLIAYNLMRFLITRTASRLRDEEERSKFAPWLNDRPRDRVSEHAETGGRKRPPPWKVFSSAFRPLRTWFNEWNSAYGWMIKYDRVFGRLSFAALVLAFINLTIWISQPLDVIRILK